MTFTILFVGSRNIGRSPLAAAETSRDLHRVWPKAADEVTVVSAGLDALPGMPVSDHAETVAHRRGVDLTDHRAQPITKEVADAADLVLTMTRGQRAQVLLQYPQLRSRTFALLEFVTQLQQAAQVRRRAPLARGERLTAKLRAVVAATRQRSVPSQIDERQFDLFDPYGYSLDVTETVAGIVDAACHTLVSDVAAITGVRARSNATA